MDTAIKFIIVLLLCGGCTSTKSSWECASIPSYSKKLSLAPKNTFQNLEIVLHKQNEDTRAVINVYGIPLKPQTPVVLTLDGASTTYSATVLEGGQRIVLPTVAEKKLLDALYQQKPITLSAGRYHTEVNYEGFEDPFSNFQNETTSFFL